MTISAGGISIDFSADLARITRDVGQIKGVVRDGAQDIERMAGMAKTALSAIGVGISVAGIALLSKHTIDALARMHELGIESGTTASAISKFEAPARAAGSSLDAVAGAIFRMSKASIEARDPSSKAGQAFAAIGISVDQIRKLKPDELFELSARQLAKYSDGAQKSAVMQELWNKSGKEMSRVAAEIAASGKLLATVTDEDAEAANRFNNMIVELKMTSEKLLRSLASDFLPTMNAVIRSFIDAKKEGGFLNGLFAAMDRALESIGMDRLGRDLEQVNSQIASARKAAADLEREGTTKFGIERTGEIAQAAKLNTLLREREQIQKAIFNRDMNRQNEEAARVAQANKEARERAARGAPSFDPVDRERMQLFKQENDQLDKQIAKLRGVGEVEAYIKKLEEDKYARFTPEQKEELVRKQKLIVGLQQEKEIRDAIIASNAGLLTSDQRLKDLEEDYLISLKERGEEERFQLAMMGQSFDQARKLTALRQMDLELARQIAQIERERGGQLGPADIERIQRMRDANELAKQGIALTLDQQTKTRDWTQVWNSAADAMNAFYTDLLQNGRDSFSNLWKIVKTFFTQLAALAATRVTLTLGANLLGVPSLASAAGAIGQGSAAGTILGAGAGAFGDFSSGLAGTYAGSELGGSVLGELGSSIAAAIGAIPVWGQIALAVAALAAFLAKPGGGPKNEGQFTGMYDASGRLTGPAAASFNIIGTSANSQAEQFATGLAQQIAAAIRGFGGPATGFQVGAGIVRDPAGTAQTMADILLRSASGQQLLHLHNDNVGRKDEDLTAELQLQGQRAILAALQSAFGNDSVIGHIFGQITDVAGASLEQINALMAQAQTYQQQWSAFEQSFGTDSDRLAAAQTVVSDTFRRLGREIPASNADFAALVRSMAAAGDDTVKDLLNIAGAFKVVGDEAQAQADRMRENWEAVSRAIDALTGRNSGAVTLAGLASQFQGLNSGFGGLSPEDLVRALTDALSSQEAFAGFSEESQKLIRAILELAASMKTNTDAVQQATASTIDPAYSQSREGLAATFFGAFQQKFGALIGAEPTRMSQLTLTQTLLQSQIKEYQARAAQLEKQYAGYLLPPEYNALWDAIYKLEGEAGGTFVNSKDGLTGTDTFGNIGNLADISRLTILMAQYGDKADALFDLEKWRDGMKAVLGTNADALAALQTLFQTKWDDILNGVASSSSLDSARARLGDWWQGLFLNQNLSPLTLQQRFDEAKRQYNSTLTLAQGGDVNAIGNLSGISQTVLELARQLMASSPAYTAFFRQIAEQTGAVAGISQADINSRLYGALPTSSPLASSADIMRIDQRLAELTTALLTEPITVKAPELQAAVEGLSTEGAGALAGAAG